MGGLEVELLPTASPLITVVGTLTEATTRHQLTDLNRVTGKIGVTDGNNEDSNTNSCGND